MMRSTMACALLSLTAVNGLSTMTTTPRTRPITMLEPIGSNVGATPGPAEAARIRAREAAQAQRGQVVPTGRSPPILVQGGSLRTWSYQSPAVERVQVVLSSEGRPLDADIELYHGPSNTPVKMRAYVEDGRRSPFSAVIETPRSPSTVAIRNIGAVEFPFAADVVAENVPVPSAECINERMTIQGGAIRTFPFDPRVESVQVLLTTDGRPLNARIELLQGPNNNKQVPRASWTCEAALEAARL